jgi:predicted dehydrogenase
MSVVLESEGSRAPFAVPRPPTGIAVIGCGYWGMNHVRVLDQLPDASVIVVCDSRTSELEKVGRAYPDVALTTDLDVALATPGVEAVVIATNAHTHHDIARRALLAGHHVLVEKPLTTDSESSSDLIALAEEHERVLLVGHTFLYNTAIRKVKDYVDREKVYCLYARRTNLGPIRTDVNAVWDLAPHDISIFNYLLDSEPEWVSAVGARVLANDREDVAFISLGYSRDVVGHIHVSWADPHKVREVVVVSAERRVVFNDLDPVERVRVYEKGVTTEPIEGVGGYGDPRLLLRDGEILSPAIRFYEPLRHECGHFLHCVRRGEAPFTPGRQGLAVVQVLTAIDRSIASGGAPVAVSQREAVYST